MPDFDPRDTSNRERLSVREVAERFIELFHRQDNVTDAFRCWVHPDYIQHNPNAPSGRDATLALDVSAPATLSFSSGCPAHHGCERPHRARRRA